MTKCDTLSKLFLDKFPYPIEKSYFKEKLRETDEISEEDIGYLISLSSKGENILSGKFRSFENKI